MLQAEAKEKKVEEVTTLTPKLAEGDEYFAVAHIFASFNDTFVVMIQSRMALSLSISLSVCLSTLFNYCWHIDPTLPYYY